MASVDFDRDTQRVVQLESSDGMPIATVDSLDPTGNLVAVLPEDGNYIVRVEAEAQATLPYRLSLARAVPGPIVPPEMISTGRSIAGELTIGSNLAVDPDGIGVPSFYKLYALPVTIGQPVSISLESEDFFSILEAGTMSVLGFVPGPSTSRLAGETLIIEPAISGMVYLRVRSVDSRLGRYTLRVDDQQPQVPSR